MMRMRVRDGIAAAALVAPLAAGCGHQAPEEVESRAVVPVTTAAATLGTIRGLVHANGVVAPAPGAELVVSAPETARIAEIPHAEGNRVRRGDVLVRFDIPSLPAEVERQAAEVQRAQAALANARANQTRARDLFDRGVAARKEVEDADRQLADAQAALAQAQAARNAADAVASRAVSRATFDGVIARRYHNPGDFVEPSASDPVLRLIDLDRLEVVASVTLADAVRVTVGAAAHLAAAPGGAGAAELKVVSRPAIVEAGTATIPIRLAFAKPTRFPANTPVSVDIEAEQHTGVLLVPAAAIVREGEEAAVFVANGDKAERRRVQTGLSDAEHVEIISGIKPGEAVLVEGQAGLPDGATVAVGGVSKDQTREPADKETSKESAAKDTAK
jgi:RND family efflux transporter MFP subunit